MQLSPMKGQRRGYILIETMFASALLAIGLSTSIDLIASARRNVTTAANRQTATSLAADKCAEIAASLPTGIADQASLVAVAATMPGFRWGWTTTTPAVGAASNPPITRTIREITCTVRYPTEKGSVDDQTRTGNNDERGEVVLRRTWVDL